MSPVQESEIGLRQFLRTLFLCLVLAVAFGASSYVAIAPRVLLRVVPSRNPEIWFRPVVVSAEFALLLVTAAVCVIFWRRFRLSGPSLGIGLALFAGGSAAFLQLASVASVALTAKDVIGSEAGVRDIGLADVTVVVPGHIAIEGPLGDTIYDKVRSLDTPQFPLKIIEINSEGGLVDEALYIARLVEQHGIAVWVGDECMSACVLVAVASPSLTARRDSVFGFHRVSPVADVTSQQYRAAIKDASAESEAFLAAHGVSARILSKARSYGPDEVLELTAQEMLDAGVKLSITACCKVKSP